MENKEIKFISNLRESIILDIEKTEKKLLMFGWLSKSNRFFYKGKISTLKNLLLQIDIEYYFFIKWNKIEK